MSLDGSSAVLKAALLVFGISVAAHIRSVGFDFTYDDHHHFVRNAFVQDLGNLSAMLPWRYLGQEFPDQGRPVLVLFQFVDRALGGSAAVGHLQSTLWHGLTATLVLFLALRLGFAVFAGSVAGILFGLHPLAVEAVAGIANREDLLATCFGLLSLLAARRALAGDKRWLIGLGFAYAAALGSKESALAVPLLLVVLAVCSSRFAGERRRWIGIAAVLGGVTACWAVLQIRLGFPSLLPGAGGTGLERAELAMPFVRTLLAWSGEVRQPVADVGIVAAIPIQALRAGQLVFGWPSAPEYDPSPLATPVAVLVGLGALGLLVALAVRDFSRSRKLTLAIGWFFAATLPVSIPHWLLNPLADRYLYLPAVGWALLVAWYLAARLPQDLGGWASFGLGLVYFGLTISNAGAWQNDLALFEKARDFAPSSARARQNLGRALAVAGRMDEAERELTRAVELDPRLTAAHYNLGVLAERRGQREQAILHYRAALASEGVVAERELAARAARRLEQLTGRR